MTAEKISNSNALASITRAKSHEPAQKEANSANVFSKHLGQNLKNIDKGKSFEAHNHQATRNDKSRQNDVTTARNHQENQKSTDIDAARLAKKQQTEKQNNEQRATEADKKDRAEEARQAKNSDANINADTENTIVTEDTTKEINNLASNTQEQSSSEELATNQIQETETNFESNLPTADIDETAAELLNQQAVDSTTLDTEGETVLINENQDQAETTNEDSLLASTSEEAIITGAAALTKQDQDVSTTDKNGKAADSLVAKAAPHLESTLGQDAEGKTSDQKGQSSENQNPFSKGKSDLFAPKEGTFAQNSAGVGQSQGQATHAPILATTPITDSILKGQNLKATGPELAQLVKTDTADVTSSINSNIDVKSSTPATQLRAAGYTSPTQSVAIQIAAKAQNGAQQFEIRLNPPELGRVDVRLEFTKDGQVNTHLIIERPETLEMLSKDARQLEKALGQAGVNIESDGLTFSLQDQGDTNKQAHDQSDNFTNSENSNDRTEEPIVQIDPDTIYRQLSATSGLDMSV